MSNEDNLNEEEPDSEPEEIIESRKQELKILITNEDKKGVDVTKMSNFFEVCIRQLTGELSTNTVVNDFENIPVAAYGIINELVHYAVMMMDDKYAYVLDFESLPDDVYTKYKQGIYTMGESKQVEGNMRAVIMDENNTRAKDITVRRVLKNLDTMDTVRSIIFQAQLMQINAKLNSIQVIQNYQIDRDRDRDIVTPFLDARDYILRAQDGEKLEDKRENLTKAIDKLTTAINAVYTDLTTTSKHLADLTGKMPLFHQSKEIQKFIEYLILDLQLATMFVGVQMQVFDFLGDKAGFNQALFGYQYNMQNFCTKSINRKGLSAPMVIHQYYPYDKNNLNFWYRFALEKEQIFQNNQKSIEGKDIYLVSVVDTRDE